MTLPLSTKFTPTLPTLGRAKDSTFLPSIYLQDDEVGQFVPAKKNSVLSPREHMDLLLEDVAERRAVLNEQSDVKKRAEHLFEYINHFPKIKAKLQKDLTERKTTA
jgi:hypothetical protein